MATDQRSKIGPVAKIYDASIRIVVDDVFISFEEDKVSIWHESRKRPWTGTIHDLLRLLPGEGKG